MKILLKWIVFCFVFTAILLSINSVSTSVSLEEDLLFSSLYPGTKGRASSLNFEEEVDLIRRLQGDVLNRVPFGQPIRGYTSREPVELFKRDTGLCYDRARTYDKLFKWVGFESRHVYVLYNSRPALNNKVSLVIDLFTPRGDSHAVTEVKTSLGWVTVDSNSNWVSISRDGSPVSIDQIASEYKSFDDIPDYFIRPYWAIRGLYSRRGHLYAPYLPVPQFNWSDFLEWMVHE